MQKVHRSTFFPQKSRRPFLVVTLKSQSSLYNFTTFPWGQLPSKHFIFFWRGHLCVRGRGRLCLGTRAQWPVKACL